jgi:hypothetical protein
MNPESYYTPALTAVFFSFIRSFLVQYFTRGVVPKVIRINHLIVYR